MRPASLAAAVAPRTGKIIRVFLKEEKICYKMIYFILCWFSQSSENALES